MLKDKLLNLCFLVSTLVFCQFFASPLMATDCGDCIVSTIPGQYNPLPPVDFIEEWDHGLYGNHDWNHMTQSDVENRPDNGTTYNEISSDNKLIKDNIRFSGEDYFQFNNSWLAFEGDGIPIMPDTYLQTKIDNIWIAQLLTDHTQNLLLDVSVNGESLEIILCTVGHCYWNPYMVPWITYEFDSDNIDVMNTNIYALIQSAGVEITGSVYLKAIQISQQIVNFDDTPASTDEQQHMEVDYIRILDGRE